MLNPEEDVLYVTSCNEKLWNATGKSLVNSFLKNKVEGTFCVCYEEPCYGLESLPVEKLCIDNNKLYTNWFERNINNIPKFFGGKFGKCHCVNKTHVFGCPNNYWNFSASRWFKKVISLYSILESYAQKYIIWIDSDCQFVNHLTRKHVKKLLEGYDSFCLHGVNRVAVETGLLGFNGERGRALIITWLERYIHQKFLENERWDDGYQYTVIKRSCSFKINDICTEPIRINPADFCKLTPYIKHAKGTHKRYFKLYNHEETV